MLQFVQDHWIILDLLFCIPFGAFAIWVIVDSVKKGLL